MPCMWDLTPEVCCETWDTLDPAVQAAAIEYATTIMWAATGKQFGLCPQTVRPCGRYCGSGGALGWFWNDGLFGPYLPYVLNGEWRNCFCGCGSLGGGPGCCSCEPHCQVYIPGPVASITEVTQDGFLVDPSAYRVDDNKWLVRTDGACWPDCQNMSVDAGLGIFEDNTMTVTYIRGYPVPQAVLNAAGTLACEYSKACMNQPCRLPGRLSTVARQGVQLTFQNIDYLIDNMFTGIPEVDMVIKAYNPAGLARPMRVWSPDMPQVRQTTTP